MAELASVTLMLQPQHAARLPAWLGRAAQAHFLDTLRQVKPEFSAAIHDANSAKPFTSSSLIGARKEKAGDTIMLRPGDTLRLRYTTLHPGLTAVFKHVMLPRWAGTTISLHEQSLRVLDVVTFSENGSWADQADYVQLVDDAPTTRSVTLSFSSPTAFKRSRGEFTPLPQPELVFSSLLNRWNAFAPFRLPDALYDLVHTDVVIQHADIQTQTLSFARGRKGTITGFTGKATYRFACDEEARRYLHALAAFAKYSGVGVKTSIGMGQVRAL